jgi:hypothetical protein
MVRPVAWSLVVLFALVGAVSVRAQARTTLVIMSAGQDEAAMEELRSTVEAYLSDLDVGVRLRVVPRLPSKVAGQLEAARWLSVEEDSVSVVWVEEGTKELLIFVSDRGSQRAMVQSLPQGSEGWGADCDAIAVIVRSVLGPWLEGDPPPREAPPVAPPPVAAGKGASGAGPVVVEGDAEARPRDGLTRAVAAAGYSPALIDGDRAWVHGAALALGALIGRHLEIDLSLHAFQSIDMEAGGADLRLVRWPVVLSATGLIPIGRFEAGVRAGLIVDVTAVRGIPRGTAPDETTVVQPGLAASFFARVRLNGWLAAWADGGVDLIRGGRDYLWDGRPVLSYARVQPRFALGLAVLLPGR